MADDILNLNSCLLNASNKEKGIFMMVLCTLAKTDNSLHPKEKSFLNSLADALHIELTPRYFNTPKSICLKYIGQITNRRLALELIKYMLILTYTDDNFTDSEGAFIGETANALQIEASKVGEISSWIIDRIIWLEQESVIFEEISTKE